jgi:hypothetical protein
MLAIAILLVVTDALIFLGALRSSMEWVTFLGITNSVTHWLGWIGALCIAVTLPVYSLLKRKALPYLRYTLAFHAISSMIAALFVSVHFSIMATIFTMYGEFGFGILLNAIVLVIVLSGLLMYFVPSKCKVKKTRIIHVALALAFYLVLAAHIISIIM